MARVCVDSNYFEVNDNGQLTHKPGSIGYQSSLRVSYLAPLNFQIADYPLAKWLYVECIGGGGGGAGAAATSTAGVAQGGGAGGGYSASWIDASTLPGIVPVVGGQGGSGGIGRQPGENGGDSSFGTLVRAFGGAGASITMLAGTVGTAQGANATPLGTGQARKPGGAGGNGVMQSVFYKLGGDGGISGWGAPGGQGGRNNSLGQSATPFTGGGGGGAAAFDGNTSGGTGGSGLVRIEIWV